MVHIIIVYSSIVRYITVSLVVRTENLGEVRHDTTSDSKEPKEPKG